MLLYVRLPAVQSLKLSFPVTFWYKACSFHKSERKCILEEVIQDHHCILFRFLSSPTASSSSLSTVSAGFRSECTLLAMLERLVCGAESRCLGGNLGPPKGHGASPLYVDGVVSFVSGGVVCLEAKVFRGPPISYCANTSRTC